MLTEVDSQGRSDLLAHRGAVRDLFPCVDAEEFYLSKMGIAADFQGMGLVRLLPLEYLNAGRAAGFHRFRLDVWAENKPAYRLYESRGFQVVRASSSTEAGMKYVSMVKAQDDL